MRRDTVDLPHQFTDERLAAVVPSVVGDAAVGDLFFGRAGHASDHMSEIEDGWRQVSNNFQQ